MDRPDPNRGFPDTQSMIWDIYAVSSRVLKSDLAFIRDIEMGIISGEKPHNRAHLQGLWLEYVAWYTPARWGEGDEYEQKARASSPALRRAA